MHQKAVWMVATLLLASAGLGHGWPPVKDLGQPKPAASPLDQLAAPELTPLERQELPGETVAVLQSKSNMYVHAAFSADSKRIALGRLEGSVELWSLQGGSFKYQSVLVPKHKANETLQLRGLALSNDGKWLASIHGSPATQLVLWQLTADGGQFVQSQFMPRMDDVAFHPSSNFLVCGANAGKVFAVSNLGLQPLTCEFKGANSIFTFAPDGTFASVYFTPERNGTLYGSEVMFWTFAPQTQEIKEFQKIRLERSIRAFALSPNGQWLATGSLDSKVRLWDLSKNPPPAETIFTVDLPDWTKKLLFTPNGTHLLGFNSRGKIHLWDVAGAKQEKLWDFKARGNGPFVLAPDGRHLLLSTNNTNAIIVRLPLK